MSSKAIPSAIAALGINAIPAAVVLLGGQSVETAMILYFLENILAILFCAARVRVLAPARDEAYSSAARSFAQLKVNDRIVFQRRPPADRGALLSGYLLASLGLSLGTAVFMAIFLFLILDMSISRTAIVAGMAGIAVFQVFNFVADLFLIDSLSPGQAEMLLQRSMGRVALLHLAVILGILLAVVVESWFVVPSTALVLNDLPSVMATGLAVPPMKTQSTSAPPAIRALAARKRGSGYGQTRVWNEPVAGRLCRSYGLWAQPGALPPLHPGGAGAGGQCLRSPHV